MDQFQYWVDHCTPGLGRRAERGKDRTSLIRGAVVKARMRTAAIVEVGIVADRVARLTDGFAGSQIDLLIVDAAPQPLDAEDRLHRDHSRHDRTRRDRALNRRVTPRSAYPRVKCADHGRSRA